MYYSNFIEPYISLHVESIKINLGVKVTSTKYTDFYIIDSYSYTNLAGNSIFMYSQTYEKPSAYIATWQPFTSLSLNDENWQLSLNGSFVNQFSTNVNADYMEYRTNYIAIGITRKF